ncbi:transglutaminaseTgpA domain-containing protein [Haloglycomyces albus]|uniref:transglutaminase family protein n=1 Tax=Haloglycomyces albus TaxID=526067 RepID=UPI0004BAB6EC|nr:DUF3488 and transglutaminase-like domain-containing protein [Haloglycomyces albus]
MRLTTTIAISFWLSLLPLLTVFKGFGWIFTTIVAMLFIHGTGALVRWRGWSIWLQAIAVLMSALSAATLMTAAHVSLIVVPLPATFSHWQSEISLALTEILYLQWPVEYSGAVMTLAILAVIVLMALHELIVGVLRLPVLSVAPLFAPFGLLMSVSEEPVLVLWFITSALAYMWVLSSDHLTRIHDFGIRFRTQGGPGQEFSATPMGNSGRLWTIPVLMVSILAVTLMDIPTTGLLSHADRYVSDSGGGAGRVKSWARLSGTLNRDEEQELLRLKTDDPSPPYLRMHVADEISDNGFTADTRDPQKPLNSATFDNADVDKAWVASVTNVGMYDEAIPLPRTFRNLDGLNTEWGYESDSETVRSADNDMSSVDEYTFQYGMPNPNADNLRALGSSLDYDDDVQRYLTHPDVPELANRVDEITAEESTAYDRVRAIQRHLSASNGFSYALETAPEGNESAILDFLDNKQGYCQQYASAMAWLAREAGVASRVVIGLTPGEKEDDEWVVTSNNYHAWVELYFPEHGWLTFDPTPSVGVEGDQNFAWENSISDSDRVGGSESDPVEDDDTERDASEPENESETAVPDQEEASDAVTGADRQTGLDQRANLPWPWLVGTALLALLLIAVSAVRPWRRRRRLRWRHISAETAWAEVVDTHRDLGGHVASGDSPRTVARQWSLDYPVAAEAFERLCIAVEQQRYAPEGTFEETDLAGIVTAIRRAMNAQASRRRRVRNRFIAPTTFFPTKTTVAEARDDTGGPVHVGSAA